MLWEKIIHNIKRHKLSINFFLYQLNILNVKQADMLSDILVFKVGSHDGTLRISWYKNLYQGTERSTGISISFFLDLSSDFIAM
jgi:hypothetical protein